jgi:hypothetical protein
MEGFLFQTAAMSPHLSDEGFFICKLQIANEESLSTISNRQALSNGTFLLADCSSKSAIGNREVMEAYPNGGGHHVQRL